MEERKRLPAAVVLNHMLKHGGITEDGLKLIKDKENLEDAEKLLRLVLAGSHGPTDPYNLRSGISFLFI